MDPSRNVNTPGVGLRLAGLTLGLCLLMLANPTPADPQSAWQALRAGEAVLVLRHALAPGVGDPSDFALGDCATQRNLNDQGRAQAAQWRALLTENGIDEARIYTSRWCRARETAEGMGVGKVEPLPPLDSFFQARHQRETQTRDTRTFINELEHQGALVLVTHQVNILALANTNTRSNEGVILALPLTEPAEVLLKVLP